MSSNYSAKLGFLLVVAIAIISSVLVSQPLKRKDARVKAEYQAKINKIEAEYGSREWLPYIVQEGDGINNALVASEIRSELGRTDSDKYKACVRLVEQKNHWTLKAGKTLWVLRGINYGKKTAKK